MLKVGWKYFWVIGSPRSGTTFLTDFIGQYTDCMFNEPWQSYPLEEFNNWHFPDACKSLVFKYGCNWKRGNEILLRFPQSCFIHILRNPDDTIYSWMRPKEDSYPPRPFEDYGEPETKLRFKNIAEQWMVQVKGCLEFERRHPRKTITIKYERLKTDIDRLRHFTKLPLGNIQFHNRNLSSQELKNLNEFWADLPEIQAYKKKILRDYYSA